MSDFLLPQMGDVLIEGVCFDTSKEEEGGAPTPRSPILRRAKRRPRSGRMGVERGHYWEGAGACSMGEGTRPPLGLLYVAPRVCASAIAAYPHDF